MSQNTSSNYGASGSPKAIKLFNVEQWYKAPGKTPLGDDTASIKVATIKYGAPYALAKSIKRQQELKNNPNGTYFKIVIH